MVEPWARRREFSETGANRLNASNSLEKFPVSVQRYDLNLCIGCRNCVQVCPMDVFRFNEEVNKSVIAFPENCQSCGQCYVYCLGHSLAMSGEAYAYPLTSVRAASVVPMNREMVVSSTPRNRLVMPAIVGVIGAMFAHNAIIWNGKAANQREIARASSGIVVRMSLAQRWQHLGALMSFIALVVTGFCMRFFSAWMEAHLGFGRHALKLVHLASGLLLLCAGLFHVAYILFSREGRKMFRDFWPRWRDFSDLIDAMGFYLGMKRSKPQFGRFAYSEKAEYWMLFCGTVTMGITGLMIWFYVWSGRVFSDWGVSFARAWHFYEAIVASLAIVVWHFYQVLIDPGVAPMNSAWIDGKMPADHYREEHPLDADTACSAEVTMQHD